MKRLFAFLCIMISTLVLSLDGETMKNYHYIIVMLEAKNGKEELLKKELLNVRDLSKKEKACIDYVVYQDITIPSKFVLYETWLSKEEHAQQFKKSYIIEFSEKIKDILNAPYAYVMGKAL